MKIKEMFENYGFKYESIYDDKVEKVVKEYASAGEGKNYGEYVRIKIEVMDYLLNAQAGLSVKDKEKFRESFGLTENEMKKYLLGESSIRTVKESVKECNKGNVPLKLECAWGVMTRVAFKTEMINNWEKFEELYPQFRLKNMFNKEKAILEEAPAIMNETSHIAKKINCSEGIKKLSKELNNELDKMLDPNNEVQKEGIR